MEKHFLSRIMILGIMLFMILIPQSSMADSDDLIDISDTAITLSAKSFTYSGNARQPYPIINYNGSTLTKGTDYIVSYENNTNVGTAEITITGIGAYTGSETIDFTINARSISKTSISLSGTYFTYSGNARQPYPTITYDGMTLVKNRDYTVSYKNNRYPGTATITISGKGNYSGIIKKNFYIARVDDFRTTSTGVSYIKFAWDKEANVTGYKLYKYNFNTEKWKLVKTLKGSSSVTYTLKDLPYGKGGHYKIRTYKTVGQKTYYGPWSRVSKVTTKPSRVVMTSVKDTVKLEATAKWKEKTCTGYQVIVSKNSNFTNAKVYTVKSNKTLSKTVGNLSPETRYYIKVRAYKTYNGKTVYGQWSKYQYFTTGDGTGWATFNGKRYYYVEGEPIKGQQTINKNKYYFNKSTGELQGVSELMWNKIKGQTSKTPWLIAVSRELNRTCVYKNVSGKWVLKEYWKCTTGAKSTRTPAGYFTVPSTKTHLRYLGEDMGYTCWYATRIHKRVYFHSVLYNTDSHTSIQDGRLGYNLSHGCIRLAKDNAMWIYDNIDAGTKVVIY